MALVARHVSSASRSALGGCSPRRAAAPPAIPRAPAPVPLGPAPARPAAGPARGSRRPTAASAPPRRRARTGGRSELSPGGRPDVRRPRARRRAATASAPAPRARTRPRPGARDARRDGRRRHALPAQRRARRRAACAPLERERAGSRRPRAATPPTSWPASTSPTPAATARRSAPRLRRAGYIPRDRGLGRRREPRLGHRRAGDARGSIVRAWMNSPGHRANILNPATARSGSAS